MDGAVSRAADDVEDQRDVLGGEIFLGGEEHGLDAADEGDAIKFGGNIGDLKSRRIPFPTLKNPKSLFLVLEVADHSWRRKLQRVPRDHFLR